MGSQWCFNRILILGGFHPRRGWEKMDVFLNFLNFLWFSAPFSADKKNSICTGIKERERKWKPVSKTVDRENVSNTPNSRVRTKDAFILIISPLNLYSAIILIAILLDHAFVFFLLLFRYQFVARISLNRRKEKRRKDGRTSFCTNMHVFKTFPNLRKFGWNWKEKSVTETNDEKNF